MKRSGIGLAVGVLGLVLGFSLLGIKPSPAPISGGNFTPLDSANHSGIVNLNSQNLKYWRKALANVRTRTARARVLVLGDSTGAGASAGTGPGDLTGAFPNSWPSALTNLLNSYFVPASYNSVVGDSNIASLVSYNTYDSRVTFGAGWQYALGSGFGNNVLAGNWIQYVAGSATTFAFHPSTQCDTFIIYYLRLAGSGTFAVNINGGATITTPNAGAAGATAIVSATVTGTLADNTLNLVATNDANFFVMGIVGYNSAIKAVDVVNGSFSGARANMFANSDHPWSSVAGITALAPDLTIIDLTINDSNGGVALSSYSASLQTIINTARLSGDVLLMSGPPSGTTQATDGTLDSYIAAMKQLAATNGAPMVDIKQRWGSYAAANVYLPYPVDVYHPGALGYADIAQATFQALSQP